MSNYSYFQDFNNSQKNQNPTFENKHLQPVHQHSEYQYSQPGNVKIPQENAEWHICCIEVMNLNDTELSPTNSY